MDIKDLQDVYGESIQTVDDVYKQKAKQHQIKVFSNRPKILNISKEECEKLCKNIGLEYLSGYESRVLEYTITDETTDRYGDIVRAKGGDVKDYRKNPVVLFAHSYSDFPIGNTVNLWRDNQSWKAWALFFDDRVDPSQRSDIAYRFASSGGMRGCSIGFIPLQTKRPKDDEERSKIGLGEVGVEFLKWSLLEFSGCSVPANPNALRESLKSKNLFTEKHTEKILDDQEFFKNVFSDEFIASLLVDYKSSSVSTVDIFDIYKSAETLELKDVLRPYPNEHSSRLEEPEKFDDETYRRKNDGTIYGSKKVPNTAAVIWAKYKDAAGEDDNPVPQAIRFPTKDWTVKKAVKWLKDNDINYLKFEPAEKSESEEPVEDSVAYLKHKLDTAQTQIERLTSDMNDVKSLIKEMSKSIDANKSDSANTDGNTESIDDALDVLFIEDDEVADASNVISETLGL